MVTHLTRVLGLVLVDQVHQEEPATQADTQLASDRDQCKVPHWLDRVAAALTGSWPSCALAGCASRSRGASGQSSRSRCRR